MKVRAEHVLEVTSKDASRVHLQHRKTHLQNHSSRKRSEACFCEILWQFLVPETGWGPVTKHQHCFFFQTCGDHWFEARRRPQKEPLVSKAIFAAPV